MAWRGNPFVPSRRAPIRGRLPVALLVLASGLLGAPPATATATPGPGGPSWAIGPSAQGSDPGLGDPTTAGVAAPRAAATATVRVAGRFDHVLRGNEAGDGSTASFSSPAVADVTGDGQAEVVTATVDGWVIALRGDMTALWRRDLGRTSIQSSPAVGDVSGDGRPDIVVGTLDGRVVLLDGPTGAVLRTFPDGGIQGCKPLCFPRGFHSTPALGDVDGDGRTDVVASSYNHFLYAWTATGRLIFRRDLYDTSWSSPVIADVDGDGANEIIVGSDVERTNHVLGGPDGGILWVVDRRGEPLPGYPKRFPGQVIWSSPAVGDLDGDGQLDIVVGTGVFFDDPAGRQVLAVTARTGRPLRGWPVATQGRVMSSPALADVDGDGRLEVVVPSEGGYLSVYGADGRTRWTACDRNVGNPCSPGGAGTHSSAAVADVDGDGQAEVISALELTLRIYTGADGTVEATLPVGNPATSVVPSTNPSVGEIGGRTVIAYQEHVRRAHGEPYARAGDVHRVQLLTTDQGLCTSPWGSFKAGSARTGRPSTNAVRWTPFSCPAPFVDQQYRDFLGREPDGPGRQHWTGRLHHGTRTGPWMVTAFLRSPEFGAVVAPAVRVHLAVTGTYPTSAAAVRVAATRLRRGTPLAVVAQDLVDATPAMAGRSEASFVTALYRHVLGRPPTDREHRAALGRLAAGTTRGAVVAALAGDPAGVRALRVSVDVSMLYIGMLGRAPDAPGYAYWVTRVRRHGPDPLIRGIQGSPEYRARVT